MRDTKCHFQKTTAPVDWEQTSTEPWSDALIEKLEAARRERLPSEQLMKRRIWRDRRLMALAAHKKQAPET